MKHPALARVFSIVLAVMSLIMLLNGAVGFGKADVALKESLEQYRRIEEKTDTYEALSLQLKNSVSYEEALAELEALQEQHDDDAAQHRTDLATHTATMGGYELGAKMILEGKEQLAAAKAELEEGKALLAEKEQQFNQLSAAFEAVEPLLTAAINALSGSEEEYKAAIALIDALIAQIDVILANRPQLPELPEEPTLPIAPPEDADEETKAAYEQAMAVYQQLLDAFEKAMEEYEGNLAEYETALAAWEQEYQAVLSSVLADAGEVDSRIQNGSALMNAALGQLPADVLDDLGGLGESDISMPDLSNMSLEEIRAALVQLRAYLVAEGNVKTALEKALASLQSQLAEGQQAIAQAKAQVLLGEKAMRKAEQELQHQLELLWYNMGQLEDETADLEADKLRLDQESEDLDRRLVSVDEKKEMEQKHRSARIVLMQEAGIASAVNAGGDLVESARAYIQNGRDGAQRHHGLLYAINALALAGGLLGLLSIPGSFEKTRRRLLLILPTVLCLVCALAADGLNMYLGLGQMYTALAAALAAAIHLATILPQNKTIIAE
ncbi:MAG: hypothetical protein SPF74_06230 [Candidatus Limivicinus sp.]|nr:hypothetical protein [Candidatus Limivicinus sp.]